MTNSINFLDDGHDDGEQTAIMLGRLVISPRLELDSVRYRINEMVRKLVEAPSIESNDGDVKRYRFDRTHNLSADWCFVDCK